MSRKLIALLIIGLAIVVLPQLYASGAEAHSEGLDITVRNITGGQPITPPIVIIHDGSVDIVPDSAESMEGLEELAEAGEQQPLIDTLSGMTGVKSIYRLGNLILPGDEDTLAGVGAVPGDSVTVIAMLRLHQRRHNRWHSPGPAPRNAFRHVLGRRV